MSKIGDVYDGGRKVGELHRSGGIGGCTSGLLLVGLLIIVVVGINQAIHAYSSPAPTPAPTPLPPHITSFTVNKTNASVDEFVDFTVTLNMPFNDEFHTVVL